MAWIEKERKKGKGLIEALISRAVQSLQDVAPEQQENDPTEIIVRAKGLLERAMRSIIIDLNSYGYIFSRAEADTALEWSNPRLGYIRIHIDINPQGEFGVQFSVRCEPSNQLKTTLEIDLEIDNHLHRKVPGLIREEAVGMLKPDHVQTYIVRIMKTWIQQDSAYSEWKKLQDYFHQIKS